MTIQVKITEAFCGEKIPCLYINQFLLAAHNVSIYLDISMDKECFQSCKCDLMVSKTCRDERSFPRKKFSSRFSDAGPLAAVFSKVWDSHTAEFSLLSLWRYETERWVKILPIDVGHSQYVDLLCDLLNLQFSICFLSSLLITFPKFI